MVNEHTRRARELLARADELLRARPRFDMDDWNARRPDPENRKAWAEWLAELPDPGPMPETDFERQQREWKQEAKRRVEARERERKEREERQRLEALAAELSRRRDTPSTRLNVPAWAQPSAAKFVVKSDTPSSHLPGAPLNPVVIRKVIRTRPPGGGDA